MPYVSFSWLIRVPPPVPKLPIYPLQGQLPFIPVSYFYKDENSQYGDQCKPADSTLSERNYNKRNAKRGPTALPALPPT